MDEKIRRLQPGLQIGTVAQHSVGPEKLGGGIRTPAAIQVHLQCIAIEPQLVAHEWTDPVVSSCGHARIEPGADVPRRLLNQLAADASDKLLQRGVCGLNCWKRRGQPAGQDESKEMYGDGGNGSSFSLYFFKPLTLSSEAQQ